MGARCPMTGGWEAGGYTYRCSESEQNFLSENSPIEGMKQEKGKGGRQARQRQSFSLFRPGRGGMNALPFKLIGSNFLFSSLRHKSTRPIKSTFTFLSSVYGDVF